MIERVSQDLRENGFWLAYVARAQNQPERLDRIRQRQSMYQAYTAEQLQQLARTYLTDDKLHRIKVLSSKVAKKKKVQPPSRFIGFDLGPTVAFPPDTR